MLVYLTGKVLLGLIVGVAFGYALQRGRFCVNTAFRDVLFVKDSTLLRAWALAGVIQLLGVTLLRSAGFFTTIQVPPFFWAANLAGGFLFGVGMVLAGGCASGTCYRVGEGMLGSLMAFLAFGMMTVVTDAGALRPVQSMLRDTLIQFDDKLPTVDGLLHVNTWWVVIPIALLVSLWLFRGETTSYHSQGWSWQGAGTAIGAVGVAAWITSTATGRPFGLSITGPIRGWFRFLFEGDAVFLDWGAFMLAGLFIGAMVAARVHNEGKLRLPRPGRVLQSLIGGALMGFGAQVAGGCNIGHSFTGLSTLSVASLVTTVAIVLGGWTAVLFMFVKPDWLANAGRLLNLRSIFRQRTPTPGNTPTA